MVPRTQHKKAHSLTAVLSFLRKLHLVLGTNKCKFILKQEMLLSLLNKSKAAEWRAFNFWGTTVYATWYFLEPVKKEREGKKPLTIQCDSKDLFCCSFFFFLQRGNKRTTQNGDSYGRLSCAGAVYLHSIHFPQKLPSPAPQKWSHLESKLSAFNNRTPNFKPSPSFFCGCIRCKRFFCRATIDYLKTAYTRLLSNRLYEHVWLIVISTEQRRHTSALFVNVAAPFVKAAVVWRFMVTLTSKLIFISTSRKFHIKCELLDFHWIRL